MIGLLDKKLISLVIDDHFDCTKVNLRASLKLVFEVAGHCDKNMTLFWHAFLSKDSLDLCLAGQNFDDLLDLANKLTRISHDDDLNFHDARVDSHKCRYNESSSLTTSIHGLEGKVLSLVSHYFWNRNSLDDWRLVIGELR